MKFAPMLAVATVASLLLIVSPAVADHAASRGETQSIARIFGLPASCAMVRVSTISRRFAAFRGSRRTRRCVKYATDGWALLHRANGHAWRVIFDGSDITCPIPGAPKSVLIDLKFCPTWKLSRTRAAAAALTEAQSLAPAAWTPPPVPHVASCKSQDVFGTAYSCDVVFEAPDPDVVCGGFEFDVTTDMNDDVVVTDPDPPPSCGT